MAYYWEVLLFLVVTLTLEEIERMEFYIKLYYIFYIFCFVLLLFFLLLLFLSGEGVGKGYRSSAVFL